MQNIVKTSDSVRSINEISSAIEDSALTHSSSNDQIAHNMDNVNDKLMNLLNNIDLVKDTLSPRE